MFFAADLLREYHSQYLGSTGIPYDLWSTREHALEVITEGICLVGPSSVAGATIKPCRWNGSVLMAHVCFWFFREAREIRILEALMRECRKAGATHFSVSGLEGRAINRWYSKLGLVGVETVYLKGLA